MKIVIHLLLFMSGLWARAELPSPGPEAPTPSTVKIPASNQVTVTEPGAASVFSPLPPPTTTADVIAKLTPESAAPEDNDPLTRERARIRLVGDYEAMFRSAAVGDVVRALAEHAQMRYIAPASESLNATVSISGIYNLLDLLDLLHEHYGVNMIFERGIWRFSKSAPDALILKTYKLRNNNREDVDITSPVINTIGNNGGYGNSTSTGGNNNTGVSNNQGSGGNSGGSNASFKVSYEALIKDIDDLIAIPPPAGDGDAPGKSPSNAGVGKAKFIPETNELMVVASAFHQDMVREYLQHVDQPLDQIEFSAYFVETSRDPQRELGLAWTNNGSINITGSNNRELNNWVLPHASILTQYQLAAMLRLTAQDSESAVVQNPSVVGLPNRKTVLDATRQIPVAQSTFNAGGTTNPSTSTSLQYLDVGTIVNIFPIVRVNEHGDKIIRLHVSLVVSSLIGETLISGNPAPLTARRRFEFSAELPEGQTLSIGGLVSSTSNRVSSKIPILSSIPIAGRLFRSDSDTASRSNMVVYITPRVLRSGDTAARPSLPKVWPEDARYARPVFISEKASVNDLQVSLVGFNRELEAVRAYIDQRRDPAEIKARLGAIREELNAMSQFVRAHVSGPIALAGGLTRDVDSLSARAGSLQREIFIDMRL